MFDVDASVAACERQYVHGMVKCAEDAERYEAIIDAVKPALVIECGTFSGKSALWLARRSGARVLTIDVADQVPPEVRAEWVTLDPAPRLEVTSTTSNHAWRAAVDEVERADGPVMVVLDSDHSRGHVLTEMLMYERFVTPDSYMVVEDGILRWLPAEHRKVYDNSDPLEAIEDFLGRPVGSHWAVDEEIEGMFPVTIHPRGWLRRVA